MADLIVKKPAFKCKTQILMNNSLEGCHELISGGYNHNFKKSSRLNESRKELDKD